MASKVLRYIVSSRRLSSRTSSVARRVVVVAVWHTRVVQCILHNFTYLIVYLALLLLGFASSSSYYVDNFSTTAVVVTVAAHIPLGSESKRAVRVFEAETFVRSDWLPCIAVQRTAS